MKYLENEKIKKDRFVKGFTTKGSDLVVRFADGNKLVVPNKEENRAKVLERMNQQADIIAKQQSKYKAIDDRFNKTKVATLTGAGLSGALIGIGVLTNSPVSEISIAAGALVGTGILLKFGRHIINNKKLSETTKIKFAVENKDYLNSNVNFSRNTLLGINNKIKKAVKNPDVKSEPIDMNLINKLSLKDLKDLKTNIEREKEFGFVYGQPKQENSFVKGLNL